MEGDAEDSEEECRVEGRPTVLWQKCIQQSIFVDLSEDESLHLSDLESSLASCVSQTESAASEPSIHLSGSMELSALDDTSSASSIVNSSQSDRMVESKTKSSILHVSAQRPNTIQDETPLKNEDSGQQTSDEDQEDLPFDGDLGSPYFNQTANSEGKMSSDGIETVHAGPDVAGMLECKTRDKDDIVKRLVSVERYAEKPAASSQADANANLVDASKPREVAQSSPRPSGIDQLLLRHFSREELLQPCRLIEAETLPEVSLLESVDDTVFSGAPTHISTTMSGHLSGSSPCNSEMNQSVCSDRTGGKRTRLEEEAERDIPAVPSADSDSISSSSASIHSEQCSGDASALYEEQQEKATVGEQDLKFPLVRTRSFSEMKYGQGQVHYRLPDFSKVSPKVKIPKTPNGPARSVPQSPRTMHRAQSSPGVLEVINRVLEDSVQPSVKPYVFKDEDKRSPPALVHHLQAKYDKLLTKYAEAENRIDQMRIGNNAPPSSEAMPYLNGDDDQDNLVEGSHLGSVARHLPPSENFGEKQETVPQINNPVMNTTPCCQPEEGPSDGERMTTELKDVISQFTQKVEGFQLSVSIMSVSTAEQQVMLRSILEAQDQLEREYISKKEEHRALEMQSYKGLSRKTGIFDPNRLVEGDIFRIGMQLEDIKEMIDRNVCEQISPPHSSSTPTPMKEMLQMKPYPLRMPTPSPPPSLHEGPSAAFSIVGNKMEAQKEAEVEEAIEVHVDSFLESHSYCHSRSSPGSLEGDDQRISVSSELTHRSNILANLSGSNLSSRERTRDSVLNPLGDCDPRECVSLAVEVSTSANAPRDSERHVPLDPPLNTSSVSQRIISPETDSGFGSSYLNQSPSGPFQPNLLTESGRPQDVGLSSLDSEGSFSNLQTAIQTASLSSQRWASPHPSVQTQSCGVAAAAAVERWVESTTKEPSIGLQAPERSLAARLHRHVSEPVLITAMDSEERGSPPYSCSCNSEAILALQSEVTRLKKDLEEGLVQLPHLAHKMDFLTSKYRRNRQERRSEKTHHGQDYSSVWKPSLSITQNVSSCSQMRIEDWISSDMDKGTDRSDTAGSEIMLEIPGSAAESIRGRVPSAHESQYKLHEALQSNRGSEGSGLSGVTRSILKGGKTSDRYAQPKTAVDSFYSKERWSPFTSPSLQKPLLQVAYGSSSSLPASYKVKEPSARPMSSHRKRSTQSDTALLPSNVYFQRTPSPSSLPSKTGSRPGRRRGTTEVEMNRTLDRAIEVARSMKRTTDQMARRLSADLAEAHCHSRVHSVHPQGGRKPHYNKQTADQFTL
ncbi:microtubule organization protein AKNA-like [Pungitius pungitius]|uniref:microtubule organization protein AKNA-like n=1 Tax=Pungitius pungitius TaxID=134920 RepID=UPI002E0EF7E8